MTNRRTFLQTIAAALGLGPLLARFRKQPPQFRARFSYATTAVDPSHGISVLVKRQHVKVAWEITETRSLS